VQTIHTPVLTGSFLNLSRMQFSFQVKHSAAIKSRLPWLDI